MNDGETDFLSFKQDICSEMTALFNVSPEEVSNRVSEYFDAMGFRQVWYHETPTYWAKFIYFGETDLSNNDQIPVAIGYWTNLSPCPNRKPEMQLDNSMWTDNKEC